MEETEKTIGQPGGPEDSGRVSESSEPERNASKSLLKPAALLALNAVVLAVVGILGWGIWASWDFASVPAETPGRNVTLVIRPGTPFFRIARNLEKIGAIKDAHEFTVYASARKKTGSVRAGEFALNTGMLPGQILKELTTGSGILHKLRVREGLTWWRTAAVVEKAGLGTFEDFKEAVHDPDLIRQYGIPANSLEGYLFPETYSFTKAHDPDARRVVRTMVDMFFKKAREIWPEGLPAPEELHRLTTLASLVEKETGDGAERPGIAGVFTNRLERRMLLQCDPTIIYGLGETFDGNLKRSHLKDKTNPYNTYTRAGLPPGPICSPGKDSLEAAAFPEKHKYLYFVAKGDGTHHFSTSLRRHNNAVIKYQLRRNRKTYRSH